MKAMNQQQVKFALARLDDLSAAKIDAAHKQCHVDEPDVIKPDLTMLIDDVLNGAKKVSTSTLRGAIGDVDNEGTDHRPYYKRGVGRPEQYYADGRLENALIQRVYSKEIAENHELWDAYRELREEMIEKYQATRTAILRDVARIKEEIVLGDHAAALEMIREFSETTYED